mmetsp:Transcript_14174/g.40182  ORF Transcript_14174/g.40182 Transcript_14174/m.40182 type:complete len:234 (+) Transcript_14174:582-1283(+)
MAADLTDGMMAETLLGKNLTVTVANNSVLFNSATVSTPDLESGNGVVHVIDKVLLPPMLPATVVDVVAGSPNHTVLTTAVTSASLIDALSAEGPFTILAPTDAAFTKALEELNITSAELLADSETLTSILQLHVIPGKMMAANLSDGMMADTLLGQELTVTVADGMVMFDNATVTVPDLEAGNGVVHAIDQVLLPNSDGSTPPPITDNSGADLCPVVMLSSLAAAATVVLLTL